MKLNRETIKNLKVLGLPEDALPKMKVLRKRYLELSLIRHSDKGGTDEEFQELLHAYNSIGKLIEKSKNLDKEDLEEEEARKKFKESNVEKINKTSVTIKILSAHVNAWDQVFTEKYGNPTVNEASDSKQWSIPYRISQVDGGVIKVTIWNLSKKKQSTMLIQGEHMKQYLNISFAENAVPKLFTEVLIRVPKRIHENEEANLRRNLRQNVRRPCKKCTMVFNTVSDLNKHVLSHHENNSNTCEQCSHKFGSKAAMDKHVKVVHRTSSQMMIMSEEGVISCEFCPIKFSNDGHLKTHVMISHSGETKSYKKTEQNEKTDHIEVLQLDNPVEIEDDISLEEVPDKVHTKTSGNDNHEMVYDMMRDIVTNIPMSVQENHNLQHNSISDVVDSYETEKDQEISKLNDQINKIVEEHDALQTQVAKLQQERVQQDIKAVRLEEEKQSLEDTIKTGYEQYEAILKEYQKIKVENKKHVKDCETKIFTLNNELIKSYAKVDQLVQENVKLKEENKVLEGIYSANEKLREDTEEDNMEEEFDEEIEVIEFYMNQNENRFNRTNPASEAEKNINNKMPKRNNFQCEFCDFTGKVKIQMDKHFKVRHGHLRIQNLNCSKCDYTTHKETLLREHWRIHEEPEPYKCDLCDFKGKSKIQMEKHFNVRHKKAVECYFWRKGQCNKGPKCLYSHQTKEKVCHNGEFCVYWPKCKFTHPEICRFQNECNNRACSYVHVNNNQADFLELGRKMKNYPQHQEPPMWRPW